MLVRLGTSLAAGALCQSPGAVNSFRSSTAPRPARWFFGHLPHVPFFTAGLFAISCETPQPGSELLRAAPESLVLTPGERREMLVRGCVYDDSFDTLILACLVQVRAVTTSGSQGIASLDLPNTSPGQLGVEASSNLSRVTVTAGSTASLDETYEFFDLPVRMAGPTRRDQCSEWLPVTFGWDDVKGDADLEVVWEVAFSVNDSREIGIDFGGTEP